MKNKQKYFDSSIIREDESKTTENTKHFILNNGTRKAVVSPNNMNYFDTKEKVWKPIDNSLKTTEGGYRANLGKYTAKFSKKSENETVEIYDGSDMISWEYLGMNKNIFSTLGNATSKTNTKRQSKLSVTANIKDTMNLSSAGRAVYTDAEGNVDLDYSIESNGIKENITIKEKSNNYHYYFLLRVSGFEMKTDTDGIGIEFYKSIPTSDDAEKKTPEFIMPAPFMYDANGERSDKVKYSFEAIEEDTFIFSVEADPEWINATERVFPVCVDPQLLTVSSSHITVTHDRYQWVDCSCCNDCSCLEPDWIHIGNPYHSFVYVFDDGSFKTTAKLRIQKSDIDLIRNKVISAKLIFKPYYSQGYSTSAQVMIEGNPYTHYNKSTLTADVTDLYRAAAGDFTVDLSMNTVGQSRAFCLPTLELEYQPIADDPIRQTLAVEAGVSSEFDVLTGNATLVLEDIADPSLGIAVSHVYKPNDNIAEYGQNFRLNLDERLVKTETTSTGAQYAYTDPQGDVHTFNEHFYRIGSNGEKFYLSSTSVASITADADGRLWLNGNEVFRELTTARGLRASARLEGIVNNAEWVDQRMDEEKQTEERVKSYENTLCNFVAVNKDNGTIISRMTETDRSSPDSVEGFLSESENEAHLLLSSEEALSYKSLLTQKESLNTSKAALTLQMESIKNSAKTLSLQYYSTDTFDYQEISDNVQIASLNIEKNNYAALKSTATDQNLADVYECQYNLIGDENNGLGANTRRGLVNYHQSIIISNQKDEWNAQKDHIADQIRGFPGIDSPGGSQGTLTKQYYNAEKQVAIVDKQLEDVNAQINLYAEKSAKYIPLFKSYYKEYLNLNNQLDTLKMQIPVAYLISDSTVKGFNAKGDLVIIQDKYGKYVAVEREKYNTSGKTRISAVYDQDGKTMRFSYNEKNKLSEICNSLGERVAFQYDSSGYLTTVERDNQPKLTLSYSTAAGIKRISKIESSHNTSASLSYNLTGMLKGITRSTTVNGIAHDNVVTGDNTELSSLTIVYTATATTLKYDKIKSEIYTVDSEAEQITARYELINGLVTGAERYTYSDYLLTKTEYPHPSYLNRLSYGYFVLQMEIETVKEVTYNSFKEPVKVVTSKYAIPRTDCDCPIEQTTVEYTYNDSHKLIEKKTSHSYCDCCEPYDTTVAVEKYYYDNASELVRKESYVEGEELKIGINIEEHVYNEKGIEIQSFSYNSLDPSSKFYTENEVDENGRALAAFDESGEHKTTFDYERDGVTVRTERLPNGSKHSYGRDKDGTVTAITHSTENGEENSTTQTRTLDVVTEVKSGNNTVRYEYDGKRRVKSVSLNGVENYVTYTYSGEHTNAETVSATMADGTVATSIKNAHGNVTDTACADRTVTNAYNNDQQLEKTIDSVSGETTLTYDEKGNVTTVTAPDHTEAFTYDELDQTLTSKTITVGDVAQTYEYSYKPTANNALDSITVDGTVIRPNTDALGRNTGKTIEVGNNKIAEEKISYVKFGDHATSLPSNVRFATNGVFNESIQYKYDSMGNIVEIFENGRTACKYEYDSLGRLTREDNVAFAKTTTWAYDNNGNIIARYEYAITAKPTNELHLLNGTCKLYTYADNSDQLMSYNGEAFVYDTIGNPTTYRGKEAVWEYGRQLKSYDGNTFTYDARGRRTAKNGITFTYDSNGNLIKQSNGLEFLYDHTGIFAVKYNGSTYFYRKDAQANIVELLDNSGTVVVKYKYDAWGNCVVDASTTNTELANINPFRYRSYYLDTETNLYFLQTRYYDPEIGRFMTIDDISYLDPESINGLNLYAYCLNSPVMCVDYTGHTPEWLKWLGIGLAIVGVALVITAATVLTCGVGTLAGTLAGAVIYGAAQGIVIGASIGIVAGGVIGGAVSGWSVEGILIGMGIGLGGGAIIGGVIGGFAGASGFTANSAYISQYGETPKEVLSTFKGNPKLKILNNNTTVYRTWGAVLANMDTGFRLKTMVPLQEVCYHCHQSILLLILHRS